MNFEKFWEKKDIWKLDPYVSESKNIEETCARYGWENCKKECIKILQDGLANCDDYDDILKKIENL